MKNTKELINRIKKSSRKDMSFLEDKEFQCPQVHYYLADILREQGMSSAEFIARMNLDRSYGYQLLNGRRRPQRELLVRTALLFHFNLEETQRLLKIGNREVLYPRVKRDAIAIFSIEKGIGLSEYQELVDAYEYGI